MNLSDIKRLLVPKLRLLTPVQVKAQFVARPRSVVLAKELTADNADVCKHGRNPCWLICGVKGFLKNPGHADGGRRAWEKIPQTKRLRWLDDYISKTPNDPEAVITYITSMVRVSAKAIAAGVSTPCIEWVGPFTSEGYPYVCFMGQCWGGHRVTEMLRVAAVLENLATHPCDNRSCLRHTKQGTRLCNQQEMAKRERSARGERHPRAVITKSVVKKIWFDYWVKGKSNAQLGLEHGVARTTAVNIPYGRGWKHITKHLPLPTTKQLRRRGLQALPKQLRLLKAKR